MPSISIHILGYVLFIQDGTDRENLRDNQELLKLAIISQTR